MILKGKSVAGAKRLAVHLARTDTNERMEVLETRGVVSDDLLGALKEMEAVSSIAKNCERPFYHASINTPMHERMTPEQRDIAIERLAKALGLENQPRVVVAHTKEDREHFHIVFSRIDTERFRVISDSHNYRTHELVARQLEREFGHERIQGAHVERDGKVRPERTPSLKELQQAERTKMSVADARAHVSDLWRQSEDGKTFEQALAQSGWTLCKGDRRDFVVVDDRGGVHSLARVAGVKAADVRNKLANVSRDALRSPDDIRQAQKREQEAVQHKQRDQKEAAREHRRALRDAVALSGSQKMVNVEGVQIQRMRRRAAQAEKASAADAPQVQAEALAKRRSRLKASDTESSREQTDRRQALASKPARDAQEPSKTDAQKGKGDREQER